MDIPQPKRSAGATGHTGTARQGQQTAGPCSDELSAMKTFAFTWLLIVLAGISLPVEVQPGHAKDVLIGYFGPNDMAHPEGGDMWCAATLAIKQANLAGAIHTLVRILEKAIHGEEKEQ